MKKMPRGELDMLMRSNWCGWAIKKIRRIYEELTPEKHCRLYSYRKGLITQIDNILAEVITTALITEIDKSPSPYNRRKQLERFHKEATKRFQGTLRTNFLIVPEMLEGDEPFYYFSYYAVIYMALRDFTSYYETNPMRLGKEAERLIGQLKNCKNRLEKVFGEEYQEAAFHLDDPIFSWEIILSGLNLKKDKYNYEFNIITVGGGGSGANGKN